jgi:OmpA-OmpF porin, OOP family
MIKKSINTVLSAMVILLISSAAYAQSDISSSKDHPMFSRMNDFYITSYEVKEFDSKDFRDSKGRDITVEGKTYFIEYYMKEGAREVASIQIVRNFENAINKEGGTYYQYTDNTVYLNLKKGGNEVWAEVNATTESYQLTIVEKKALEQEITANDWRPLTRMDSLRFALTSTPTRRR